MGGFEILWAGLSPKWNPWFGSFKNRLRLDLARLDLSWAGLKWVLDPSFLETLIINPIKYVDFIYLIKKKKKKLGRKGRNVMQ